MVYRVYVEKKPGQTHEASGLLKDGFSFQTGAGGASLAAAKFLKGKSAGLYSMQDII